MPKPLLSRTCPIEDVKLDLSKEAVVAGDGSGLAQTLQEHIDDIRCLLQCGICIRPLYEPFTLACGHTFCYSCLMSWFANGRSNRTCPDCRNPVKSQPAPAYLIRSLVQMFIGRAELLEKGETTTQHEQHQKEEAEKLEMDKANTHPRVGGLFRGIFKRSTAETRPIIDVDDNVFRCPVCAWELEDAEACARCGYNLSDDNSVTTRESRRSFTDTEGNSEMDDYMDDIDGFDDEDLEWDDDYDGGGPFDGNHDPFNDDLLDEIFFRDRGPNMPNMWFPRNLVQLQVYPRNAPSTSYDERDDAEDSEQDTDMDSFIEDERSDSYEDDRLDSDRSTVVGDSLYRPRLYLGHGDEETGTDVSMAQEDDDDAGTDTDSEDSHDDDSESDEPVRTFARPRPTQAPRCDPQIRQGQSHNGVSVRNPISIEDDSDEGPIGTGRRNRNRRPCGHISP